MTAVFGDAVKICLAVAGLDLKRWLIQVHKEYAKEIEAARKKVFPNIRAVDDFLHMLERMQNTLLQKFLKNNVVAEEEEAAGDTDAPPASPVVEGRTAGKTGILSSAGVKRKGRGAETKKMPKTVRKFHYDTILQLIRKTRLLPPVQLFDAVWRVIFHIMRAQWKEPHAADYLYQTDFSEVRLENVQQVFKRVTKTCWKSESLLLAGHWYGILGTAPGTGTGSQTIEARHSNWQTLVEKRTRSRC